VQKLLVLLVLELLFVVVVTMFVACAGVSCGTATDAHNSLVIPLSTSTSSQYHCYTYCCTATTYTSPNSICMNILHTNVLLLLHTTLQVKGKNELKEFLSVTVDLLEGGSLEAEAERTGVPLDEDFLQKLLQVYSS
jgi:hypothetical protein